MAINWDFKISNVNLASKRANISVKRTDDVTTKEESYDFTGVIIETPEQRTAFFDQIWQMHLDTVNDQTTINDFIASLDQDGKSNLEAREV